MINGEDTSDPSRVQLRLRSVCGLNVLIASLFYLFSPTSLKWVSELSELRVAGGSEWSLEITGPSFMGNGLGVVRRVCTMVESLTFHKNWTFIL